MDVLNLMKSRRSIRKYDGRSVEVNTVSSKPVRVFR